MLKSIIAFLQFLDERREKKLSFLHKQQVEYIRSLENRLKWTEDMLVDEHGSGLVQSVPEERQAVIDRTVFLIKSERNRTRSFIEVWAETMRKTN